MRKFLCGESDGEIQEGENKQLDEKEKDVIEESEKKNIEVVATQNEMSFNNRISHLCVLV